MNDEELTNIFKAFDSGQMSPDEAAEFKADIDSGIISRPKGVQTQELPSGVIDAYFDGTMDVESRLDLEDDIKSGIVSAPKGIKITPYAGPQDTPDQPLSRIRLEKDATFDELAVGAGETGLALATGATGGTVGNIIGTLQGIYEQVKSGKFGTQEGAKLIQEKANELSQALTYEPTTTAGQEILKETAETLAPLEALGPLGQQIEGAVRAFKPAVTKPVSPKTILAEDIQAQGIKPLTTDIIPPKTFIGRFAQATGEKIPVVGTGGLRATQQAERVDAVRNTLRDFGAVEAADATTDVMQSLLSKRGGDIKKYATTKNEIITKLKDKGEMPVSNTIKTIDEEITKLQGLKTKGVQPAIDLFNDFKESAKGQSIENIEILRKQLGEEFKSPDYASVKTTTDKAVNKIYGSLKKDMGDFIKTNGDRKDFLKWEVSNKRLSNMMGDLKNSTLKSTLAKGEATPELVKRMLFSQKPSEIKTLYKNLTPKGRENARSAILHEAFQKAGGIENMTPEKFVSNVNRLGKSTGVFFKGEELKKVNGLIKALKATKRASEASVAPATGVQLTPVVGAAALTDLFGGFGAGVASAATIGGIARLYESKAFSNLLIKIANAPKAKELPLVNALLLEIENLQQNEEQ